MRLKGIDIPENKRIAIALTYLYGIGNTSATKILKIAQVSPEKRTKDLTQDESDKIRVLIEKEKTESDLRREITGNIKRLKEINTYRGTRHTKRLPTKGQRTKTNSRTGRPYQGRKTMTSGRRKVEKK